MKQARSKHTERGASALEFALVLPLLLVFVFGIIEFGVLLYDKAVLTNASREGARVGILYRPEWEGADRESEIKDAVDSYLGSRLITFKAPSSANVTASANVSSLVTGDYLTVTVDYSFGFLLVPAVLRLLPGESSDFADGVNLQAITTMRAE